MKKTMVFLVLMTLLMTPITGFASSPWVDKETYDERTAGKLQLGLTNTVLGWTDLFIEPIRAAKGCNQCENVWTGIGKGAMDAVANEVGGALQLVTFPLMVDFPLPDDGVQFSTCCGNCPAKS